MRLSFTSCLLTSLFVAFVVSPSLARADETRPQRSTQSGDDYDRALLSDPAKAAAKTKNDEIRDLDKKLSQELGAAAQSEDQQKDKLSQAIQGMRDVQTRLAQGNSDAITQHVERQIVADLQQIIDEAKKSGKCLGQPMAANRNKPGQPGGSPNAQPQTNAATDHPAGESDPDAKHEPKQPAAERAAIAREAMKKQYQLELQSRPADTKLAWPREDFLPEYERDIEDYFRRISSGKPTDETPATDKPTAERP